MGETDKRGGPPKTVLAMGLSERFDELYEAMTNSASFAATAPHGPWLRARYDEIVPAVMPDTLRSLDLIPVPGMVQSPALEMLALVASGRSNEQIAEATAYSPQAVKWHLARVMCSWKVGNRASLVSVAFLRGVLTVKKSRSAHPAAGREDPTGPASAAG